MGFPGSGAGKKETGLERARIRLAVFAALSVALFVALFARLWFLQVLAVSDYQRVAKNNRVRLVESEPERGRILDRNHKVLVDNRLSVAVTVDRQVVDTRRERRRTLRYLAKILDEKKKDLRARLLDTTVSPYKPVAVANDVSVRDRNLVLEHKTQYPGIDADTLPVRLYPRGVLASQILGYVNEITEDQLDSDHFKGAKPRYHAGDIVGQAGLEYTYDRLLRGTPEVNKVVVDSDGNVVSSTRRQEQRPGQDLILSLDAKVQRLTERALEQGLTAARSLYEAPAGGAVVMDPNNGQVLAMASYPTYNPSMLADGITTKEFDSLGQATPDVNEDDKLLNRPIQGGFPPGSTFKLVTAGAAMWSGVADPYTYIDCPGAAIYPPDEGPGSVVFNNWTSADFGAIGFPTSLEISCDTFYYELGWRMEQAFGPPSSAGGDGTERFQRYMRMTGFGHDTGIDLPNEFDGRVPDERWCDEVNEATDGELCASGWLPGYTINMSIGQGDLLVTPLQMAVAYAAVANGGDVLQPRLAMALGRSETGGEEEITREFEPKVVRRLPLDETELAPLRQGLVDVISGDQGTATSAFAGYPQHRYPIAGKTGTAQIGLVESGLNYAWFTSYAPADDPRYVVVVYLEKAGHGGESAAPVARQIYEGLFGIDKKADVRLGQDESG